MSYIQSIRWQHAKRGKGCREERFEVLGVEGLKCYIECLVEASLRRRLNKPVGHEGLMHMDSRGWGRWRTFQTEGRASANVQRLEGIFSV